MAAKKTAKAKTAKKATKPLHSAKHLEPKQSLRAASS